VCSFECLEGFESVAVNPQCLSSIDLQVERIGGPRGTLVVFATFCLMSLLLWIMIVVRSRFIKQEKQDDYWSIYEAVLF
jgi:hypothetical protein